MLLLHLAYSEGDLKFKAQSSKLEEPDAFIALVRNCGGASFDLRVKRPYPRSSNGFEPIDCGVGLGSFIGSRPEVWP
jgi:hypothetical protein|tara:strand:- start:6134 stop:6364 length:231 start_codon:yes stop_codon:yes gene_type:complete